eukprot:5973236-Amphidinium_carterae.1
MSCEERGEQKDDNSSGRYPRTLTDVAERASGIEGPRRKSNATYAINQWCERKQAMGTELVPPNFPRPMR